MNKLSYNIKQLHDPNIKVGDKVRLIDGSALTLVADDKNRDTIYNYSIVYSYPAITGINLALKEIEAKVIEIDIKDRITTGFLCAYLQDIIVEIGTAKFRTCSDLVRLVK